MFPRKSGQGFVPRYGGGWMHQFAHVYALQQELLDKHASNWFRAVELWHTARHEGIALNSAHYGNMLRQCVPAQAWEASLGILRQMRRDAIRPDVTGVACAMATCADAGQQLAVQALFAQYRSVMQLDSQCYLALAKSLNAAGDFEGVLRVGSMMDEAEVPILPSVYEQLLLAADATANVDLALQYVERAVRRDRYAISERCAAVVLRLAATSSAAGSELSRAKLRAALLPAGSCDSTTHLSLPERGA